MGIFFKVFIKVFAFLSALALFFILAIFSTNLISQGYKKDVSFSITKGDLKSENTIALLRLNGPILNEPPFFFDIGFLGTPNIIYVNEVRETLERLKIENIKGLVVSINSPGGSVSASHNLYQVFDKFSNENSINIFFHTSELIASGAYWASLSGENIFANYGSLIGSIGVRGPDWYYYDKPISLSSGAFGGMIETQNGIKKFSNISGTSKDLFDSFRPPTEKELQRLQNITKKIYSDFASLVSKKRKIELDVVINDIGAMIFDSHAAKENFLIDDIANLDEALEKIAKRLSIENYKIIEKNQINQSNLYNLFMSYNKNSFDQQILNEICNTAKFKLSALYVNSNLISSCQ